MKKMALIHRHKRVAVFTFCTYDVINSPMINSVEYLASRGYAVDIFARDSFQPGIPVQFESPKFRHPSIRYLITKMPQNQTTKRCKLLLLKDAWREVRQHVYDFVIGFDPVAFQHAWIMAKVFRIPVVFHSLEISQDPSFTWWQNPLLKIQQTAKNKLIRPDWMITQDTMRADWLSCRLRFPREKISVVYNSSFGDYLPQKSRYLREKYGISDEKKLVLAVGSLKEAHMILEIAKSVCHWPLGFVLVVHGWFDDKVYEEKLRAVAQRVPGRIFISTEILSIERKYDVFQSADVGIVAFKPDNDNNLLVGAAAGKLFEFARCGVPIVANDLPGMRKLIGGYCGEVCGPRLESIETVLQTINRNYDVYVERCAEFYDRHEFSACYRNFLRTFREQIHYPS